MPASELWFFLTTRKRFDVYFFAYPIARPYFFLAPAKHIISMQYDGGPDTAGFELGAPYRGRIPNWLAPIMRKYVEAFVTTSEFGKRGLIEARGLPAEKIHVVYGGSDDMFRPIPKDEAWALIEKEYKIARTPLIIASGRLDPHKNILRLVEAFDILKKRYRIPHKLIVTGGAHMPDYSQKVFALIKERELEDDCIILHVRQFSEMPYFYSAAEVMVFPSLYEGFGLPLAEAMRCGVPTIASRSSSLIEVGGDASAFFDPVDPEDMARAIHAVLSDPTRRSRMIERGREQAKKFTWEQYCMKMTDIIKALGSK